MPKQKRKRKRSPVPERAEAPPDEPAKDVPGTKRAWTPQLLAAVVALVVATLVVYGRTKGHDFISLDDPDYVTENPWVRQGLTAHGFEWAFTQSHVANWHPLTWLSHMLDTELFGMDAGAHHLVNVGWHVLNVVLLFLALRLLTGRAWPSLFAAALFALHPLHVESVAWISERKDVLSTAFWMGTLLAYGWYVRRPGVVRYALVAVLLALGLTAKSMLVTLPCVLLLLDFWPLRRKRPWSALVLEKLPLFALVVASATATVLSQRGGGAVSSLDVMTLAVRVQNALGATVWYLVDTVWPAGLTCYYPHAVIVAPDSNMLLFVALAGILVLGGATAFALRLRATHPYVLVGWLWYLGTLVPVIGLVQVGEQARADRYTYVPLIGIFVALAWGAAELAARRPAQRTAIVGASIAALVACTALTWRQVAHWRGSIPLFEHAVAVTTDNYWAHHHLGVEIAREGKLPEATRHLEIAHALKPYDSSILTNLGIVYAQQGRDDEAIAKFEQALRQRAELPGAHMNLGVSLMARGELDRAEHHFRKAIEYKPEFLEPQVALGQLLVRREEYEEARRVLTEALRLWPDSDAAHYQLGVAQGRLGELDAAGRSFLRVIELVPDHPAAHKDLGRVRQIAGDAAGAVASWRRALALDPSHLRTANDLALILATHPDARVRDGAEAMRLAEQCAQATQHRDAIPLATLAAACAEAGRFEDAVQWQRQAIPLAPPALQAEFRARLDLYARHQPYRTDAGR